MQDWRAVPAKRAADLVQTGTEELGWTMMDDKGLAVEFFRAEYHRPYGEAFLVVVHGLPPSDDRRYWEWSLLLPDFDGCPVARGAGRYPAGLEEFGYGDDFAVTEATSWAKRRLHRQLEERDAGDGSIPDHRLGAFEPTSRRVLLMLQRRGVCRDAFEEVAKVTASRELRSHLHALIKLGIGKRPPE